MLDCNSLKVSALVTDKERPNNMYLAEDDVVLIDPPISLTVSQKTSVTRIRNVFNENNYNNIYLKKKSIITISNKRYHF